MILKGFQKETGVLGGPRRSWEGAEAGRGAVTGGGAVTGAGAGTDTGTGEGMCTGLTFRGTPRGPRVAARVRAVYATVGVTGAEAGA